MKILLLNSPWVNNSKEYGVKSGTRWGALRKRGSSMPYFPFPYFLASATSVLKQNGFNARLIDAVAEELSVEECLSLIKIFNPDLLVVDVYTPSIHYDLNFIKRSKNISSSFISVCGAHSTALPQEMLSHNFIDFVLMGEYDNTLKELAEYIKSRNTKIEDISGLAFKKNDSIIVNPRQEDIEDLDSLPFPDRTTLPMKKYNEPLSLSFPNARVITSRGCFFNCIYCVEPIMYKSCGCRMRSVGLVVDEVLMLRDSYGVKEVFFDDTILKVPRARKIAEEFIKQKVGVDWSCWIDWNASRGDLEVLKKSGCVAVKFGIETVNKNILKGVGRPIYIDKLKGLIRYCKEVGLVSHGAFMIGLPGESPESIQENIKFAFSSGLDSCQFSIATPLPGTPFYKMAKTNGWLLTMDWSQYEGVGTPVISYPNCSQEDILKGIKEIQKQKVLMFFRSPTRVWKYIKKIYLMKSLKGFIFDLTCKIKHIIRVLFFRKTL